jgi:hypothetical protein
MTFSFFVIFISSCRQFLLHYPQKDQDSTLENAGTHPSSPPSQLRTCDQVEVSCLVIHTTRFTISVWTPAILTNYFLGFPQSLKEMSENTSKQQNQYLQPGKLAPEGKLLTCIPKILSSNLGRDTYYHHCFRGFPQAVLIFR